jgi:hypothetical protein
MLPEQAFHELLPHPQHLYIHYTLECWVSLPKIDPTVRESVRPQRVQTIPHRGEAIRTSDPLLTNLLIHHLSLVIHPKPYF